MDKVKELWGKLRAFWKRTEPGRQKTARVFKGIGRWIYNLRGLFMAIPVGIVAVLEALKNLERLPDEVGLLIQTTGDYQWMVSKGTAVLCPLLLTAVCLLLMFCSRRTVYPWLISIFTLVLPLLIYVTNVFPA